MQLLVFGVGRGQVCREPPSNDIALLLEISCFDVPGSLRGRPHRGSDGDKILTAERLLARVIDKVGGEQVFYVLSDIAFVRDILAVDERRDKRGPVHAAMLSPSECPARNCTLRGHHFEWCGFSAQRYRQRNPVEFRFNV